MKKIVLVFTLFLTVWQLTAQDFGFGVKGGINVASIGGNTYTGLGGLTSKVSFHLGGVVEIPFSDKIAVQPELLYSSQGSSWDFGTGDSNLKLDYINVPVMGKYYIFKGLSAEAGPLVGFLIASNEDDDDRFKKLDVGIAIGASYRLNENIFFGLRYNKGIANINGEDFNDLKSQNNVFQIFAGYSF